MEPRRACLIAILLGLGACAHGPAPAAALWLGGDVHLGDGAAPLFEPAPPPLVGAAGVVNLEGPVGRAPAGPAGPGGSIGGAPPERGPDGRLRLRNDPAALPPLRAAGVVACGVANNHAGDLGPSGAAQTAAALRRADLVPVGGAAGPALLRLGALRVAVTAHDLGAGAEPLAPADLAALEAEWRRARARADALVVTLHTTGPPSYLPGPRLVLAAERALRAGAAVVAAHGSHSIGKVERRGAALIAWGLGNLRFSCDCTDEPDGLVLRVDLGSGGVRSAAVLPIEAGLRGRPARAAPGSSATGILDLLEALGSRLRRQGAMGWVD